MAAKQLPNKIEVPTWVIAIFIPIIVTIFLTVISTVKANSREQGTIITKISTMDNRLKNVESILITHISNGK